MALSGLRTRIVLKADRFKFSIATAYSTTLQPGQHTARYT